jgi:hypothetical protein
MQPLNEGNSPEASNPLSDLQFKTLKRVTREEYDQMLSESSGLKLIVEEASSITKWPDYKFSTADGRTYGLFLDGDSILKRIDATGVPINWKDKEGIQQAKDIAGFILEIDGDDPPLIFKENTELAMAWEQLHVFSNVPTTREEDDQFLNQILDGFDRFQINNSDEGREEDDAQA